jgi:hypothetical protein
MCQFHLSGSTPKKMNCASVQIELDTISDRCGQGVPHFGSAYRPCHPANIASSSAGVGTGSASVMLHRRKRSRADNVGALCVCVAPSVIRGPSV